MSDTTTYRVAIIGTGRPRSADGSTGFGMAHAQARGYEASGKCQIVGLADLVAERAQLFSEEHAGGKAAVYTDYEKMLSEVKPDIVSVCTWPALHAPMVIAAAEAGARAIHCEKPMAPNWGDSKRMADVCAARGVQLSFNHQRRFLETFQTARRLVKEGGIGQLVRLEGSCGDMLDWGTHWLNMFLYYNDETPGEWVMGQVDARKPRTVFGVPLETHGMCSVRFQNGVHGLLFTGEGSEQIVGCANRLVGTDGTIEIHNSAPHIRIRSKGDTEPRGYEHENGGLHGDIALTRAIVDVVEALDAGRKPLLDVSNALPTTEIIYATYESAHRRGRVDLPLTAEANGFIELLEQGVFPDAKA
jgi:predicted dehydrogenase